MNPPAPTTPAAGVYVHVPFCRRKCPYCDFFSVTDVSLVGKYLAAVETELAGSPIPDAPVDTIYFGGGTPSLIGPAGIARLLNRIAAVFPVAPGAEISMESNPGTVDPDDWSGYRAAGVNRITIGVQSFDDKTLQFLGRIHTAITASN